MFEPENPLPIIYTTAPVDYDWGWTKVLADNVAVTDRGESIRKVEVEDDYHADCQYKRYCSGNYFTRTPQEFDKEVRAGYARYCGNPVYYFRGEIDLSAYHDWPEAKQDTVYALIQKWQDQNSDFFKMKSMEGGLLQKLEVKGNKELFERVLREFKEVTEAV